MSGGVELNIRWEWSSFDALGATALYAVCAAREAVFVVEQNCAYLDLDGLDHAAVHLIGWCDTAVAAYLRVLPPHSRFAEPSIGRVLTAVPFRGLGLARSAMHLALGHIADRFPATAVRISAQAYLERFYREFGFVRVGPPYAEDGIPHVEMLREHAIA